MTVGTTECAPPATPRQGSKSPFANNGETRELQATSPSNRLEVAFIDPLVGSGWDDLVSSHSSATIFHTAAWARVLARSYGHKPFYLHFSRGNRSIALLPLMEVASPLTGRRGVCLPFSDFCAPLPFGNDANAIASATLFNLAAERKWKYVELRGEASSAADGETAPFCVHTLDLSGGAEAVFSRCHSSVQRAIRKSGKSGVTAEISRCGRALEEFYSLHCQTRKRHGVPPQAFTFFRHIQDEIIAPGHGFVALVRKGGDCVAAAMFFHRGNNGLFKFGASEKRYQDLRPNHLAMWSGIRHLAQHGCTTLHLGRTDRNNEGLRRYKRSWGTAETLLAYSRLNPVSKFSDPVLKARSVSFSQKFFRHMPHSFNAIAGRLIYPHMD